MSKRVLLIGGAVLAGRWALNALANALSPVHSDVALHAGLELTSKKRRVLVIAPRRGDAETMIGGTLKLLAARGSHVAVATLSKGEAAGADALGSVTYQLNLPEGDISSETVYDAIQELVHKEKPDCILAFDPAGLGPHPQPDHAAAGAAILEMTRQGLPEGVRVYLYGGKKPNVLINAAPAGAAPSKEDRGAATLLGRAWAHQSAAPCAEGLYRVI